MALSIQLNILGDQAIKELTKRFDKVDLQDVIISAPFPAELMKIDEKTQKAIDIAFDNIKKFHEAQKMKDISVSTMPGITCMKTYLPIEKAGLYVPGGSAGIINILSWTFTL